MKGDYYEVLVRAEKHLREMHASEYPGRELVIDEEKFALEVMLHVAIWLSLEELQAERRPQ